MHGGVAWNQYLKVKVKVMDSCPPQANLTTRGHSRVTLRKAFSFCGWSMLCAAIGFSFAGEQWIRGVSLILNPDELVSGISTQNLANLEVCFAGMLLSALFAVANLVRGCVLFASERRCEV